MDPSSPAYSSVLLELASTDDPDAFKKAAAAADASAGEDVDLAGLWFCRTIGSTEMAVHHRTPLMVAAAYGSTDVLRVIIAISTAPIDRRCGPDGATALHCAASGGAPNAADAVKILLSAGADPDAVDSAGRRPADVTRDMVLARLLGKNDQDMVLRISTSTDSSPSTTDSTPSPTTTTNTVKKMKKKEYYPVDPSLPDIKNMVYATDEFRMYSFKVRPCSRAYSHDWTECPYVHPGENARRRDPRKFNYSCVPCPDFRKGDCSCLRGDNCDYAHGVFESWLHPAQYRTKLCKDGTGCDRRVCFFAHTDNEIRTTTVFIPPNGSAAATAVAAAAPSPRSASRALEMAALMGLLLLLPPSPSAGGGLSPSPFAPPPPPPPPLPTMSPGGVGVGGVGGSLCNNHMLGWPQQPNVPMLHLPSNNHQSSRLRSALNARDVPIDDFSSMLDLDACFSPGHAPPRVVSPFSGNGFYPVHPKTTLPPTNLDGLFSAEISSSPIYDQGAALFSPSHKATLLNQFHHHHHHHHQQQQALLSPINTGLFSPRAVDARQHASLLHASFGMQSPGRMSPRSYDQLAVFAQREKLQQFRSLSSRDLNVPAAQGFPVSPSMSKWGSPTGKLDWGVNNEELDLLKGAGLPLDLVSGGDDVSPWSWTVVPKPEMEEGFKINAQVSAGGGMTVSSGSDVHSNPKPQMDGHDVLDAWLEELDN